LLNLQVKQEKRKNGYARAGARSGHHRAAGLGAVFLRMSERMWENGLGV